MKLRCTLGDRAFVKPGHSSCEFMRGRMIQVVGGPVSSVGRFGPGWLCEGHLGVPLSTVLQPGHTPDLRESVTGETQRVHLPDSWLLPFRPPKEGDKQPSEKPLELEVVR